MYLKSLEIQGFKSFPDKISLTFDKGLTAVVGPNGSGKSNIGDSVRWVLGEQSTKTLRGNKMEDVIFSGTVARKPMGFAAVTLNIDNSDKTLADMDDEVAGNIGEAATHVIQVPTHDGGACATMAFLALVSNRGGEAESRALPAHEMAPLQLFYAAKFVLRQPLFGHRLAR